MGRTNFIVCMDCGEQLNLGKYIATHQAFPKFVFAFIYSCSSYFKQNETSQAKINAWVCIEHFMMRHRTHEIRVLPEELIGRFETNSFPVNDYVSFSSQANVEDFISLSVGDPDQDIDAAEVDPRVRDRLLELSQGKNIKLPR
jgi:hypothetical protein